MNSMASTMWRGLLGILVTIPVVLGASGCGEGAGEPEARQASTAAGAQQAPVNQPAPAVPAPDAPPVTSGVGPQINFDKTTHSFGDVWDVAEQQAVFHFTNTGDAPLEVSSVKTSCGCTAAQLDRMVFQPGEGDVVRVSYKPKGFGTQQQTVRLITNAVPITDHTLSIVANVKPFVRVEPPMLKFGQVSIGKPATQRFTIDSVDPNLAISSIKTNNPGLTARLVDGDTTGPMRPDATDDPIEVEVTLTPERWGNIYGAVSLETRGRLEPGAEEIDHTVRVSVNALAFGEVIVEDVTFRVNGVTKGETFERRLRVTHATPTPFTVSAEVTRCTLKNLSLDVEPVMEPGVFAYDLVLRGDTSEHRGPLAGEVMLYTDVPGEETLRLTITGKIDGA